jgi:hypothetical protein
MNGIKLALANLIGSIFEFGMVAFVFVILIACIVYFTGYNKKALPWLVNGIVMEIVLSCFYMAIMGTTGPPDITIFFRAPGAWTTMAYRDKEEEKPRKFWFEQRRVERAGVVPVPAGIIAAIAITSGLVALASCGWLLLLAIFVVAIALPLAFSIGAKPACYFDAAHDVLAVRRGISWRLLAGFRATQLPTNVAGNQDRLLRNLSGIGKGITFRIVVSRHMFPRVAESRPGSWFEPESLRKETIGAETAGHAWMLVLDRHVSLLRGMQRELAAFIQARDATSSTFPNKYMHHGFRTMNGEELAKSAQLLNCK